MKGKEKETEICIEIEQEVLDAVRGGFLRKLAINITADSYHALLENFDGNLILQTEELPDTFYGCYFCNNGEFPYIINDSLVLLRLINEEENDEYQAIIKNKYPIVGHRFKYEEGPESKDEEGDACVWQLVLELAADSDSVSISPNSDGGLTVNSGKKKAKTFLMRWNPSISSFKEEDYSRLYEESESGIFRINWSIFDWEVADKGDYFYMMRVGDNKAGIVFAGQISSDPYTGKDWAGSDRKRCYVDLTCFQTVHPDDVPLVSLDELNDLMPQIDWANGHSGVLLPEEEAETLMHLWLTKWHL